MSLYPTLEDMKVSNMMQAQAQYTPAPTYQQQQPQRVDNYPSLPPMYTSTEVTPAAASNGALYPTVGDYMGLSLRDFTPPSQGSAPATGRDTRSESMVVAPVSRVNMVAIKRSMIKPGVSEVTLCKDEKGLVGMRVRAIDKGIFVQFVAKDSPAAQGGVRFGDQLLSINDELLAGYSEDKVHKVLKKCGVNGIRVAVRERPFERVVTLTKDSGGITGFGFKDGRITEIVKDSSAARNGLLIDHQLVELNGVNVIGLKDSKVKEMLVDAPQVVTLTIMPVPIYNHMIKKMGSSLFKTMDHSVPDC